MTNLIKANSGNLRPPLIKTITLPTQNRKDSYNHDNNSVTFMQLNGGWFVLFILHEMTGTWFCFVVRIRRKEGDTAGQTAHKQARCSIHHDQTKVPKAKHKQQKLENESKESN